jgi:hypothetical protein
VKIDQECVGYALECVRLAGLTDDQQIRERLLEMARDWMALAGETDKWKRGQADRKPDSGAAAGFMPGMTGRASSCSGSVPNEDVADLLASAHSEVAAVVRRSGRHEKRP